MFIIKQIIALVIIIFSATSFMRYLIHHFFMSLCTLRYIAFFEVETVKDRELISMIVDYVKNKLNIISFFLFFCINYLNIFHIVKHFVQRE